MIRDLVYLNSIHSTTLFLGIKKLSPAKTEMEGDMMRDGVRESGDDATAVGDGRRSAALDDAARGGNG